MYGLVDVKLSIHNRSAKLTKTLDSENNIKKQRGRETLMTKPIRIWIEIHEIS
jgi:hypothetical protein